MFAHALALSTSNLLSGDAADGRLLLCSTRTGEELVSVMILCHARHHFDVRCRLVGMTLGATPGSDCFFESSIRAGSFPFFSLVSLISIQPCDARPLPFYCFRHHCHTERRRLYR